ncbi:MAG: hypothetical protein HS113_28490 [Verrucomicrobiales bacterium]|nr:hypothetical protein [Verrucomicrobiales bacterium]
MTSAAPTAPGTACPRPTRTQTLLVLALAALALWAPSALAHTHVEIVYREGQLRLLYYDFDYGEADPADVRLEVGLPAARPIPPLSAYTHLLGEAGATTWILPQAQDPELLWLGIGNESLRATDFAGPLQLTLQAVEGPGHFALFFQDPFGQPIPGMNSRDGLDGDDTLAVPLGSHLHCNWAFSAPGRYRLRFVATGTLRAGNTPIASAPTDWFFDVVAPPPPVLTLTRAPGDTLQLALEAQPGLNYALEHTATFADWTLLTNLHASVALTLHSLPADPEPTRFLRARLNTEEVQQEANGTFLTEHP